LGTPTKAGTYSFKIKVTDSSKHALKVIKTVTITIS